MEIEFIEDGHIYLCDGVITPSVSDILKFINPNKYKDVPSFILEDKASFGINIHKAIEHYEMTGSYNLTALEEVTFKQYLKLKGQYIINPLEQEILVHYEDKYCGRLDMIVDINFYRCLVDIKTTAKLDTESLEWQLGMYKLAYEGVIGKCYCLWLPKNNLGKLVEIQPKSKEQILKVLKEYEVNSSK